MNNNAKIFIYIEFTGSNLPTEKIKELWIDGDVYFSMHGETFFEYKSGEKIVKIRQNDYCNVRYEFMQDESTINDILTAFLMKQKDCIGYISNKYVDIAKRIHLCIYPVSEQYTLDFSIELLNLLLSLNLEIGATILQLE